MRARLRQLGKDSFVYGVGEIIAKGVGFFLLPIYTRIFTPAQYGTIETLAILNMFLGVLLIMGMNAAQSFYFFEEKKFGKLAQSHVVTAILQWRLIWGSAVVILATFLSPLLNAFFFDGKLTSEYFAIAFISALFVHFMGQSAEVFRLLYQPLKYISITLGYAVISFITSLILVVRFGWGIKGHLVGFCIGAIAAAMFGLWAIREYLDFSSLHRSWWPKLIKFGAPLIPAGLAMYALQTTDRWFIIHYHGQGALGIYAVGAKFVILISLVVDAFCRAWWTMAMDALHQPEEQELFRTVARLYLGLGVICVLVLTSLSPLLIKYLSGYVYHSAYPIIGILSWSTIFYGFYSFISAGIWKEKKTPWASIAMGIAVLINIVLDFFLVPKFGGVGAAIGTSISFFIWNIITLIISERFWPINYPLAIFSLQISIGTVACWWILFVYQRNLPVWYANIVTIVVFFILIFSLQKYSKLLEMYRYMKTKLIRLNK